MSRQGCCRVVCYAGHCLMCLQLFCPSPACPIYVLFFFFFENDYFPAGFPCFSLVCGQQTLSHLAQGDPCCQRQWQNKKLASVFTRTPSPTPNHPSVSILFSWLTFKATSVSGVPHASPPPPLHLKSCSTSSSSLGLPKIQVLRC